MALLTKYSKKITPENVWKEYPRMNLQRDSYTSLNGMWKCEIVKKNSEPRTFNDQILVPFPVGSYLSGHEEVLKEDEMIWYMKEFEYEMTREMTILHFEAVDQKCVVFLNGKEIGSHQGGYLPFSFNVSNIIQKENKLLVAVMDKTENSPYGVGKQRSNASGIFYKPTAGIWGSVWLEDVAKAHVSNISITPYFDEKQVLVELEGDFEQAVITIRAKDVDVFKDIVRNKKALFQFKDFIPWETEKPFLYDVYVETEEDYIKSYFGMRKFTKGLDSKGNARFFLNNKPLFLTGLLDQGYYPDGLVTYPSDNAMIDELLAVKAMGFNMLRKHVKIENARYYYHCDQLGILVMQDMVSSGNVENNMFMVNFYRKWGLIRKDNDYKAAGRENSKSREMFEEELMGMVNHLKSYTSIFAWCIFNEGWGQFDSLKYTEMVSEMDGLRLIDHASGWFDQGGGDFASHHEYKKYRYRSDKNRRINLLSEFGGFAYLEVGHALTDKIQGGKKFKDKLKLSKAIKNCYENEIIPAIPRGLAGCVYTQLSDVETELNGLFTYDRKVCKVDAKMIRRINQRMVRMVKR